MKKLIRNEWQFCAAPNPSAVMALGGYSRKWVDRAIECWSAALSQAAHDVASLFKREEWQLLAEALGEQRIDPAVVRPGQLIADAVLARQRGATKTAQRCAELDYLHAWAVVWACDCYWDLAEAGDVDKSAAWWTVEYRRAHARPMRKTGKRGSSKKASPSAKS